ncbi:iron-containing redox enzyme family protein [Mariprofundus sp. NF]|uniref:TenA family transcriptional regulator n=1 Tax=Mariprofundus sp. NF TaxID=2608716 RepID=UPI0015A2CE03|nr:iron-containing redox enzyme family protein [Mariprofundus sp. NF]NWF39141.1 iron-containing redox enzyme family protein [Mariprofundus sp. NF]
MDFYDQLLAETESERNDLLSIPFIQMGAAGQLSLKSYIAFLTQAYHHVKHTTPLLMATGGRLPGRLEWLREAVGEYIEEEMGHQEWILNDIQTCGGDEEAVRSGTPSPSTELMVAYAYDTVYRNNPVGFFGMVLVLEGTSVSLATHAAGNIEKSLGLPKQAFSYLNSHGSLDVEHVDFYEKLMNRLDSEQDRAAVIHGARMFYKLYGDIFRALPIIELN